MKKRLFVVLTALFALTLVASGAIVSVQTAEAAPSANAEGALLSVYASFYPMYDFAAKIGGDKVTVVNMVPSGMEPHDWEPTAADIIGLENADVFIYNGAGMEHWVADVLPTLQNQDLVVVEAAEGLELREGHHHEEEEADDHEGEADEHEDEEDHDHGEFDPHVWLNPLYAKKEAENIKNAFVLADPENKGYYEENYAAVAAEFDLLDQEYRETLGGLPNKDFVVSHEAFGYLAAAYDLHQIGVEGLAPDSEPDPARVAEIIDLVKENKIRTIFFEELASPKVAESIAKETGAETGVLSPVEGLSDEELAAGADYFSVMRANLSALKNALQ